MVLGFWFSSCWIGSSCQLASSSGRLLEAHKRKDVENGRRWPSVQESNIEGEDSDESRKLWDEILVTDLRCFLPVAGAVDPTGWRKWCNEGAALVVQVRVELQR